MKRREQRQVFGVEAPGVPWPRDDTTGWLFPRTRANWVGAIIVIGFLVGLGPGPSGKPRCPKAPLHTGGRRIEYKQRQRMSRKKHGPARKPRHPPQGEKGEPAASGAPSTAASPGASLRAAPCALMLPLRALLALLTVLLVVVCAHSVRSSIFAAPSTGPYGGMTVSGYSPTALGIACGVPSPAVCGSWATLQSSSQLESSTADAPGAINAALSPAFYGPLANSTAASSFAGSSAGCAACTRAPGNFCSAAMTSSVAASPSGFSPRASARAFSRVLPPVT